MKAALYRFANWLDERMHEWMDGRGAYPLAVVLHYLAHELAYLTKTEQTK